MDKIKYLDFDGLSKYDFLIKKYISSHNNVLSDNIKTYVDDKVSGKQDIISDLETIRLNAEKGSTALQEDDLKFVTNGDIDDIF